MRIVNQPSEAFGLSGLPCVFPFRYKVSQSSVEVTTFLSLGIFKAARTQFVGNSGRHLHLVHHRGPRSTLVCYCHRCFWKLLAWKVFNSTATELNYFLISWGYCPRDCPSTCTPGSKWSSDACNSCTCSLEGKAVCSEQESCSPPFPPSSSPSTKCLTESGPSKNIPCVLPFSFQVTK